MIRGAYFLWNPSGDVEICHGPDRHRRIDSWGFLLAPVLSSVSVSLIRLQRAPGTSRCCPIFLAGGRDCAFVGAFFLRAHTSGLGLSVAIQRSGLAKNRGNVRGTFHDTPFSVLQLLKDSARSIGHSLKVVAIYVAFMIGALLLLLIPGIGAILYTVAGCLLSSYMFAYEYLGYPMDRRRFTWKEKQNFLRSRFRSVIGFGLGNVVVATIPFLNLLFIPAAVVGGTLLFLDLGAGSESGPGQTHESAPGMAL